MWLGMVKILAALFSPIILAPDGVSNLDRWVFPLTKNSLHKIRIKTHTAIRKQYSMRYNRPDPIVYVHTILTNNGNSVKKSCKRVFFAEIIFSAFLAYRSVFTLQSNLLMELII